MIKTDWRTVKSHHLHKVVSRMSRVAIKLILNHFESDAVRKKLLMTSETPLRTAVQDNNEAHNFPEVISLFYHAVEKRVEETFNSPTWWKQIQSIIYWARKLNKLLMFKHLHLRQFSLDIPKNKLIIWIFKSIK